jgi:hypothetical protein
LTRGIEIEKIETAVVLERLVGQEGGVIQTFQELIVRKVDLESRFPV